MLENLAGRSCSYDAMHRYFRKRKVQAFLASHVLHLGDTHTQTPFSLKPFWYMRCTNHTEVGHHTTAAITLRATHKPNAAGCGVQKHAHPPCGGRRAQNAARILALRRGTSFHSASHPHLKFCPHRRGTSFHSASHPHYNLRTHKRGTSFHSPSHLHLNLHPLSHLHSHPHHTHISKASPDLNPARDVCMMWV